MQISYEDFKRNFNPIIVLFLTKQLWKVSFRFPLFQSYYSLIFNYNEKTGEYQSMLFQSYYSLIFNQF